MVDVRTFTSNALDSAISAFKHMALTQAADGNLQMLGFIDQLCTASEDAEGFTR